MLSGDSNGVRPALIELTSARLKEFIRETEAIFWVFGFPLLLTLLLGFAFREKAPDRTPVGIVSGTAADGRRPSRRHHRTRRTGARAGRPLHRLPRPRSPRHEPDGDGDVGHGLHD